MVVVAVAAEEVGSLVREPAETAALYASPANHRAKASSTAAKAAADSPTCPPARRVAAVAVAAAAAHRVVEDNGGMAAQVGHMKQGRVAGGDSLVARDERLADGKRSAATDLPRLAGVSAVRPKHDTRGPA